MRHQKAQTIIEVLVSDTLCDSGRGVLLDNCEASHLTRVPRLQTLMRNLTHVILSTESIVNYP